ncbi:MAG: alpha/beta hydrolase [Isosphaeraceae bacterium]
MCDVRRAAAWLAARPGVDPERLGIAGVSLGGIVGSVAAAVDPSLKQAALLLAGATWPDPLGKSPEPEAAKAGKPEDQLRRTPGRPRSLCRPFDPLTHGQRLQGKKVLMFAGRADEVIPPDCSKALWEVAGRPAIEWLDCGHYSAAGLLLPAFRRTVDFFAD